LAQFFELFTANNNKAIGGTIQEYRSAEDRVNYHDRQVRDFLPPKEEDKVPQNSGLFKPMQRFKPSLSFQSTHCPWTFEVCKDLVMFRGY
jgi:hypothetical protein